jgi:predicted transcriptional regulator
MQRKNRLPPLGELELAALEHLWRNEEADVIETHASIGRRRGCSVNTVGSALERLHRKGLVARRKVSHAYRYAAALGREEFQARRLATAVGGAQALSDEGVLSAFVDLVARTDESALDRLAALIAERRKDEQR